MDVLSQLHSFECKPASVEIHSPAFAEHTFSAVLLLVPVVMMSYNSIFYFEQCENNT